jgi:CheY-like chemotaxis protein
MNAGGDTHAHQLDGLKILVVEDESIISFLIEDMLLALGCGSVWHAGAVAQAIALLNERRPDAAVLDLNLSGEPAYPIAENLEARGIPFVFATGYGAAGVAKRWTGKPVVQKPFTLESLETALRSAL